MLQFKYFINKHYGSISALVLGFLSFCFFLGIDNKLLPWIGPYLVSIGFGDLQAPKYIALIFLLLYILVSFCFSFFKYIPTQDKREISSKLRLQIKLFIWIQSCIFTFASFLYYTTVKKALLPFELDFRFLQGVVPWTSFSRVIVFHTGYVFLLLLALGFFVNQNLFGKNRLKFFLLWCETLIFAVLGFGFVDMLNVDRSSIRIFNSSFLSFIVSINPIFWILLSIIGISVVSVIRLRQNSNFQNFCLTGLFIFLLSQFVVFVGVFENIIYIKAFSYWHKSIFLAIYWSMIFYPIATIIRNNNKENFIQKTWLSFVYHIIVFILGLGLALV